MKESSNKDVYKVGQDLEDEKNSKIGDKAKGQLAGMMAGLSILMDKSRKEQEKIAREAEE